jgi:16S rRNA (guanine966-N2)-methyltransferase
VPCWDADDASGVAVTPTVHRAPAGDCLRRPLARRLARSDKSRAYDGKCLTRLDRRAVRVIGGLYGGRPLVAPRGSATRPTSDRVREAVFSILGDVQGARVLDLFAGSGALGIEALSRGAAEATLVDSGAAAVDAIRRNLGALEIEAEVVRQPVARFLERAHRAARQYDLVFLDPPYRHADLLGRELTAALGPVLATDARVVSESDRRHPLELDLGSVDERRYGDTLIRIHDSR